MNNPHFIYFSAKPKTLEEEREFLRKNKNKIDLGQKKDKLVLGVVNFPPRKIGPFLSEVLTLGIPDKEGNCVLIVPDKEIAEIGGKLY